jgi:hypothetical protein
MGLVNYVWENLSEWQLGRVMDKWKAGNELTTVDKKLFYLCKMLRDSARGDYCVKQASRNPLYSDLVGRYERRIDSVLDFAC